MRYTQLIAPVAALAVISATGCKDFLTGGDLSRDPNRPQSVTAQQLFVGVQTNSWALYGSDLSRIAALWTQQAFGAQSQYQTTYQYGVSEATTNGQELALYAAGGLVDIRKLQQAAIEAGDTLMLGIAQVQEAMVMGLGADIFGDLVYSQALQGGNPELDPQATVYAAVEAKLDSAIVNINKRTTTDVGPEEADLVYGQDTLQRQRWTALAHTLKARYYLHQAEVDPTTYYPLVLAQASQGIQDSTGDYKTVYSGQSGENNLLYQFTLEQRPGYITPDPQFIALLQSRNDPRFDFYISTNIDTSATTNVIDTSYDYGPKFISPTQPQYIATADENRLMLAEALYRTGSPGPALTALNVYRGWHGISAGGESGPALLREILTEKYIALFHQVEPYNDYKRTCFPNLAPTISGKKIPARLYYDTNERQTDPNIPPPEAQPTRNANDPANAQAPFGTAADPFAQTTALTPSACLAQ